MKEIKAYIRTNMLDAVVDALETTPGLPGVAFNEVDGFGHRAADGRIQRVRMVKLEIDVPDDMVGATVQCIQNHARTGSGHPGDGRIYVSDISNGINIMDGRQGDEILRP